ncbi:MAG TPA: cellulase family glycosylhydrolase [Nitrososphaeraceae archaeon]|nr:cellulase family glycosylhydrolase [Nitrososphaeraceae archaeon]
MKEQLIKSQMNKDTNSLKFLSAVIILSIVIIITPVIGVASAQQTSQDVPYLGVDMSGFYTRNPQARNPSYDLPVNYFEDSFRLLSEAGMNHVRFILYWEAYVKDPASFMSEINAVANAADKWGIRVIYDNHQFHTSSWLNPQRGTGFPSFLFENNPMYPSGAGGGTRYPAAQLWWTDWWNRSVKDVNGRDGWTLLADFLKKIVSTVDSHPSTLGYEILSEPQVHNVDQWEKIGNFNTLVTNELRTLTQKTIAYSMNIPVDLKGPIDLNSENLAKMAPANKTNVVFKISLYGLPSPDTYQGDRLNIFVQAGKLAGVPLYIGEWNNVVRQSNINEQGEIVTQINPELSDINQTEANLIVKTFKDVGAWGMAYWQWNVDTHQIANYNLISTDGTGAIQTTNYFDIVKNAYSSIYPEITSRNSTG